MGYIYSVRYQTGLNYILLKLTIMSSLIFSDLCIYYIFFYLWQVITSNLGLGRTRYNVQSDIR